MMRDQRFDLVSRFEALADGFVRLGMGESPNESLIPAMHPRALSQRSLRQLVQRLSTSTAAARRRMRGLDPNRENDVLPTALALLAWMEGCRVSSLRAAPGSLRDGLMHLA